MQSPLQEACGRKGIDDTPWRRDTIVNGQPASHCEWKWQACIMEAGHSDGACWCGGTLVTERWVITAAHCVVEEGVTRLASSITVTLGEYQHFKISDGTEVVHALSKIVVHPQYDANLGTGEHENDYDIALLELADTAVFNDCVGTACLPKDDVLAGTSCFVTGWGNLQSGGDQPQMLQEAEVTTVNNEACRSMYQSPTDIYPHGAQVVLTDRMFCAKGMKDRAIVDSCQGDSGGPLVCKGLDGSWSLMGVVSWGWGCAHASYPGVYTRVHRFKYWIASTMHAAASAATPSAGTPAPSECVDNHAGVRDMAMDNGEIIGGCSDVVYLCDDPEIGVAIKAFCCQTCSIFDSHACEDHDAHAIVAAGTRNITIRSCADAGSVGLCDNSTTGAVMGKLCCASCSSGTPGGIPADGAPPTSACADHDEAAMAAAAKKNVHITGCASGAYLCKDAFLGPAISALCCQTCGAPEQCVDHNAVIVQVGEDANLTGCADISSFCGLNDVYSQVCCQTCGNASQACVDHDDLLGLDAPGYNFTGCAGAVGACNSPMLGEFVQRLCCETCSAVAPGQWPGDSPPPPECPSGWTAQCCDPDGSCADGDDDWCCDGQYYCSHDGQVYSRLRGGQLCPAVPGVRSTSAGPSTSSASSSTSSSTFAAPTSSSSAPPRADPAQPGSPAAPTSTGSSSTSASPTSSPAAPTRVDPAQPGSPAAPTSTRSTAGLPAPVPTTTAAAPLARPAPSQSPTPKPTKLPTPAPTIRVCSCTTPNAGKAGHNCFTCSDSHSECCGATEVCYQEQEFPYWALPDSACAVQTELEEPVESGATQLPVASDRGFSAGDELKLCCTGRNNDITEVTTVVSVGPGSTRSGTSGGGIVVDPAINNSFPVGSEITRVNPPTPAPTPLPTASPTLRPTPSPTPTASPTEAPSPAPLPEISLAPTPAPTALPTTAPTGAPSAAPLEELPPLPTASPTARPPTSPSRRPTSQPTAAPTALATTAPTAAPSPAPLVELPPMAPTAAPSPAPLVDVPPLPTTSPTARPSASPSRPTVTPAPTASPTEAPTASPTTSVAPRTSQAASASPTEAPTASPTTSVAPRTSQAASASATTRPPSSSRPHQVHATGDPHMQNIHGEKFDLMQTGKHTLLQIPRGAVARKTLLRVDVEAEQVGRACGDLYIHVLNVTGTWASRTRRSGYRFLAVGGSTEIENRWLSFDKVELKVVKGHTREGAPYLNFFVRNLKKVKQIVGGLLGEDDHHAAATPNRMCQRVLNFLDIAMKSDESSGRSMAWASAD